ncbi:hypothetical protein [Streptomyces sp. NL15-2K]|uniref:hypothetical protein n=1 Tax=Streptomyces sp. NL15-2K TaxID=376149 RepID=UPI000FFA5469|nr:MULTISPECIES: hypothetical protein [Actinomycetes]WKX12198.1 hypothetical protein Q4V64_33635 [Kutzneria buriramensis]GCB46310.1 hypothetical protein SNL152K_3608 [Streptomyces sp. NL15-2K]
MLSGDQPYAGHDPTAVLLLSLAGLIATPWLTLYGIRLLIRARTTRTTAATVKPAAFLAWAATVGMYTWGILHLFFFDDPDQARACNEAIGTSHLTGYAPSFIPLHFGCRTSDGHVVEAVIPSYLNPAVSVLGICAVALTGFVIARRKEEIK